MAAALDNNDYYQAAMMTYLSKEVGIGEWSSRLTSYEHTMNQMAKEFCVDDVDAVTAIIKTLEEMQTALFEHSLDKLSDALVTVLRAAAKYVSDDEWVAKLPEETRGVCLDKLSKLFVEAEIVLPGEQCVGEGKEAVGMRMRQANNSEKLKTISSAVTIVVAKCAAPQSEELEPALGSVRSPLAVLAHERKGFLELDDGTKTGLHGAVCKTLAIAQQIVFAELVKKDDLQLCLETAWLINEIAPHTPLHQLGNACAGVFHCKRVVNEIHVMVDAEGGVSKQDTGYSKTSSMRRLQDKLKSALDGCAACDMPEEFLAEPFETLNGHLCTIYSGIFSERLSTARAEHNRLHKAMEGVVGLTQGDDVWASVNGSSLADLYAHVEPYLKDFDMKAYELLQDHLGQAPCLML